ncbi:hypothetical protein DPMN_009858 [Dreissena polymorpha]|uniref:Uncharacterized protein n=1 Tax=Dreissena polymorpha TaxID=45954 RepID=A0A9D4MYU9_DREPO|nr:hypothetical protein DPMN_009858 [Dreissena polymorpha]
MTKKSWFGSLMGSDREEHHFVMVRDKPLCQIKADLIHAFLSSRPMISMYCLTFTHISGPSRRFRRVCEHIQNLMLGPRGDALSQRKISTDSSSSYTSECSASPTHSISVTRTDCDDETPVFDRISKTPTPQRRDIPRVITNGRRVIIDPSLKRKDKM